MCNRGIRQQAFDIFLRQGKQVAHRHRHRCHRQHHRQPINVGSKADEEDADENGEACALGGNRKECRHGCGSAFVHIRSPEVKRHQRNFESNPDQHHQRRHHERKCCNLAGFDHFGDVIKIRLAAEAEEQTETVKHHGRSHRAEEKILETRLGGFVVVVQKSGEGVQTNGGRFDSEIQHDQISRHRHEVHAEDTADQHREVFAFAIQLLNIHADQRRDRSGEHKDHAEEK